MCIISRDLHAHCVHRHHSVLYMRSYFVRCFNSKKSPPKYIIDMTVYIFDSPVNSRHPFIHLLSYFVLNSEASQSVTTRPRIIYRAEIQQLVPVICHQRSPKKQLLEELEYTKRKTEQLSSDHIILYQNNMLHVSLMIKI